MDEIDSIGQISDDTKADLDNTNEELTNLSDEINVDVQDVA